MKSPLALYVHWPFCKSKCPYCDFNSHVRDQVNHVQFKQAYLTELAYFAPQLKNKEIVSIFFGGGTPSLMPADIAEAIIIKAREMGQFSDDIEITLEANPTSVEASTFGDFKAAGVNRVSLGVQALNNEDLRFLGREHNVSEALEAVDRARKIFDRYSFDLIYARPNQTVDSWEKELKQALHYIGGHASLYQLTIEKGTPFYRQHQKGDFLIPEENNAALLYECTESIMKSAGMHAYEVSNYAKEGQECKHNLMYWHYQEYLGIGAGAHSRLHHDGEVEALMTIHHPENWLQSVLDRGHGLQSRQLLTQDEILEEFLLMGMRLSEGIAYDRFQLVIGKKWDDVFSYQMLKKFNENGLLNITNSHIQATHKGRMVLNQLVSAILTER